MLSTHMIIEYDSLGHSKFSFQNLWSALLYPTSSLYSLILSYLLHAIALHSIFFWNILYSKMIHWSIFFFLQNQKKRIRKDLKKAKEMFWAWFKVLRKFELSVELSAIPEIAGENLWNPVSGTVFRNVQFENKYN